MKACFNCNTGKAAIAIGYCVDCLRTLSDIDQLETIHSKSRQQFDLPDRPPRDQNGITCQRCANSCQMIPDSHGFCGIRYNKNGKLVNKVSTDNALAHIYLDPLPTNCCAGWFCRGQRKKGYNLAVFFYGCNFDCLFCQNSSHKRLSEANVVSEDEMVSAALDERVRCVCFFGGSPEPQLPYAIRVAQRIIEESGNQKHICWEWNGSGDEKLVIKAAETAYNSGGTVKFDLKFRHPNLAYALCGVDNYKCFDNFSTLANLYHDSDLLTATTLLVPCYTDRQEVRHISKFIAWHNQNIPYSLLVFHPDYYLRDLPFTPKGQVFQCYEEASIYLSRVNIGNKNLLHYP
jgi:pyruvate formate lyase activating enzyme